MVATGRHPNTGDIGLDVAGVEIDDRGYVKVNDRLETTAPDVWAMGDCAGSPQFTHVGFDDFRIVRDNLMGGQRTTRNRLVPYCMFTDPELGRVGLSESLRIAVLADGLVAAPAIRRALSAGLRAGSKHQRYVELSLLEAMSADETAKRLRSMTLHARVSRISFLPRASQVKSAFSPHRTSVLVPSP